MRIALIGSHNTGKTSLYDKMYSKIDFSDFKFFPEVIREVAKLGFKINEESDDAAQLAMCAMHLKHLYVDNFVTDRCLLDNFVYAWVISTYENSSISMNCVRVLDMYFRKHKDDYDLYVYCPIEFDMKDDGFRTTNTKFQEDIDKTFRYMLNCINPEKVLYVSGETVDRYEQVLSKVKELKSKGDKDE